MNEKGKYDTNPLDSEVAERTDEVWGATRGQTVGATDEIISGEAPTRLMNDRPLNAPYPSVFVPPVYAPPAVAQSTSPASARPVPVCAAAGRNVEGLGIPDNIAMALPYAPFYIGLVISVIELFLVPRKENAVRFHASQALALHLAFFVIDFIFGVIRFITGNGTGGKIFWLGGVIFFVYSMIRAWNRRGLHITAVDEGSKWLDEKFEPRK